MDKTILQTILVLHIVLIGLVVYIAYNVRPVKEGYLADYYKLRQCRCIPQYDKPTFTDYN